MHFREKASTYIRPLLHLHIYSGSPGAYGPFAFQKMKVIGNLLSNLTFSGEIVLSSLLGNLSSANYQRNLWGSA